MEEKKLWYVVNAYSGHEQKVKDYLESRRESMGMENNIFRVIIPERTEIEVKDGVKKEKVRKMFPGYVLIEMIMSDEAWYVVRNTRGVTGFVGPGSKPVPLSDDEMKYLGINKETIVIDAEVGDMVEVTAGAWEGTVGSIKAINPSKQTITIDVEIFGRATSVEIAFADIKKL
mgnify:CR=1 FL=1